MMYESKYMVYRFPSIRRNPQEFAQFVIKVFKPYKTVLPISAGIQVLVAMFVTHSKVKQYAYLRSNSDFTISVG